MTVHGAAHILVRSFRRMLRAGTIIQFPGVAFFTAERCCLCFAPPGAPRTDTKQTPGLDVQTLSVYENNFEPRASRAADATRLTNCTCSAAAERVLLRGPAARLTWSRRPQAEA